MLQKTEIGKAAADVKNLSEYHSLVEFGNVNHLHARYHIEENPIQLLQPFLSLSRLSLSLFDFSTQPPKFPHNPINFPF